MCRTQFLRLYGRICRLRFGGLVQRVINIDSSADALQLARRNIALNGFHAVDDDFVEGDVFQVLRYYRDMGQQFDMIILDPPKFAQSPRQVESAARGYKDINLLAFRLLKPGGVLVTFSCSGAIDESLFQKIVFGALADAGREAQIVRHLEQAPIILLRSPFPKVPISKGCCAGFIQNVPLNGKFYRWFRAN